MSGIQGSKHHRETLGGTTRKNGRGDNNLLWTKRKTVTCNQTCKTLKDVYLIYIGKKK